ncbi:MAG: thioredoxin family protein [Spirochaetia bacterium]|nr:thioredoxin family protein [Spirochaetia bacterium]
MKGGLSLLLFFSYSFSNALFAVDAPKGWISDLDEAKAVSLKESKPIFLDLYTSWCPYCEKLHDRVYTSKEFKHAAKNYITVSINIEKQPDVIQKYSVSGTPVILFLDHNGYVLDQISGYIDPHRLSRIMDRVLKNAKLESSLLKKLSEKPKGVLENYRAGVYYSDVGNHKRARHYFLNAWNSSINEHLQIKMDSLYNAAVSSMEMEEYSLSISQWNAYIAVKQSEDEDYVFARFYRGMAYKFYKNNKMAKKDLQYAVQHLKDDSYRRSARKLLEGLK